MTRALVIALVLAACHHDPAPARPVIEPDGFEPANEREAELRDLRDRACACANAACAEQVRKEHDWWTEDGLDFAVEQDAITDEGDTHTVATAHMGKLDNDLSRCLDWFDKPGPDKPRERPPTNEIGGYGGGDVWIANERLEQLRALRDRACLCADQACGDGVKRDHDAWTDRGLADNAHDEWGNNPDDPTANLTEEDAMEMGELEDELDQCLTRFGHGAED